MGSVTIKPEALPVSFELDTSNSKKIDKYKKLTLLCNDIICKNQGYYAQYAYFASVKHKEMKEEFYKDKRKEKLTQQYKALETYLNNGLDHSFKTNFELLHKYFKSRLKNPPRFCIKCSEKDSNTNEILISDYLRDNPLYKYPQYLMKENRGFFDIFKSGRAYHCNDIPDAIKKGQYWNSRIDKDKALLYNLNIFEKFQVNVLKKDDQKWINCWDEINDIDIKMKPDARACYKSTVIIPMTLLGNNVENEFKEKFKINNDSERAFYGFLCIDHHCKNYFELDIDIPVGYIFSDLMSLYLITALTYREFSSTYKEVKEFINT